MPRLLFNVSNFMQRPSFKTFLAFWILGLINNVLYVLILSAALDLVGADIPKGVVLVADVLPSFVVKLLGPYFIHFVPYGPRIICFALLSAAGMLLVAHSSPSTTDQSAVWLKLVGVSIASASSGGGELSFLGLTHFHGHLSLASWSSGTGAAGLVGALAYAFATITVGLTPATTILCSAFLPSFMLVAYFALLPPAEPSGFGVDGYQNVPQDDSCGENEQSTGLCSDSGSNYARRNEASELGSTLAAPGLGSRIRLEGGQFLKTDLKQVQALIIPYMLPLLLVYVSEYTINQGVTPTLLFPLQNSPFGAYREFYPTYMAIYQAGVFVSRSSTPFLRIHRLYPPTLFQLLNLVIVIIHALYEVLPSVWFVFAIIAWEGLLGGAVYVNTYAEILDNVQTDQREFSLSATAVSDSFGILLAAMVSIRLEPWLYEWQMKNGRDFCKRT